MKFPYGMSDFNTIVTEGYVYCDRTAYISLFELRKRPLENSLQNDQVIHERFDVRPHFHHGSLTSGDE